MPELTTDTDDMQEMLAHHEKTIEDLSTQIADQWKTIVEMERKLDILTRRFVVMEDNSLPTPHDSKPPHY